MSGSESLVLSILPETFAVCRMPQNAAVPGWVWNTEFTSITRTHAELSIVCTEADVPEGIACERGWRALQVQGPLAFGMTGIVASMAAPLASEGISIFTISTYDTDYLLVRADDLPRAMETLQHAGHRFIER